MGLLNAVRNLFSGEDRKLADTTKDLRVLLIASMKIVGAYEASVKDHPLILMGTPDPYAPP
jgi:hypothetical protein